MTIVVLVLMTSYHVSLNAKSGPVAAHSATTRPAHRNADGRPVACDVAFANRPNQVEGFVGLMEFLPTLYARSMITLYHAPRSRSSRMIWLLEELGARYEIAYVDIKRPTGGARDPARSAVLGRGARERWARTHSREKLVQNRRGRQKLARELQQAGEEDVRGRELLP